MSLLEDDLAELSVEALAARLDALRANNDQLARENDVLQSYLGRHVSVRSAACNQDGGVRRRAHNRAQQVNDG